MKVLIAEDDLIYANTLEILFTEMNYESIKLVHNGEELLKLLPILKPDLLVLDIHIEGNLDGIEVAEKVHEFNPYIPVIFITSHQDNTLFQRAKSTKPYAFLIKPFDQKTLLRTIELAFQQYQTQITLLPEVFLPDSLFIKIDQIHKKIYFSEIGYIEADDHYLNIITQKRKYLVRFTLYQLLEKLPEHLFLQISRRHIIHIHQVSEMDTENHQLTIFNEKIPFSKRRKQEILDRLILKHP
jgi:DNA-binding LytR/AlgR family response regulator